MIERLSELEISSRSVTGQEWDDLDSETRRLDSEIRRREPIMRRIENAIEAGLGDYSSEYDEWRGRWWNARIAALQAAGLCQYGEEAKLRLRVAASLDEDLWIAVRLPGDYEGADNVEDGVASARWTTVVTHPDELGWLREALQQRAASTADDEDEDDLEPL